MRTRLIVALVVVAVLAGLASAWFINLILPWYHLPGWLADTVSGPGQLARLLDTSRPPAAGRPGVKYPPRPAAIAFMATAALVLLAVILGVVYTASRRVLLPVRRLAQAAQAMSGGDLSVRIQARGRDELAQLVTSFNEMAAALEGKVGELRRMEARARQFAGDVSHELRTPLTAMTAVTDVLGDGEDMTGDAAAAAQLVRQEVRHLNRLVEDLIEVSRFDTGTARLVTDDTDVATAVARCLRARGWTDVRSDVPAGLSVPLDRRRFDVILANLLGNAARHGSPPLSVTASIRREGPGAGHLAVAVRDHGPGLAPEEAARVFDRFYKADSARARSEGSGLGLAIAWENARLHGGHIEAASHPDGGALFTVRLPLEAPGELVPSSPAAGQAAAVTCL